MPAFLGGPGLPVAGGSRLLARRQPLIAIEIHEHAAVVECRLAARSHPGSQPWQVIGCWSWDVPQTSGLEPTRCQHLFAVRIERDAPDTVAMPHAADLFAGGNIPQSRCLIPASGQSQTSVRAEGNGVDVVAMPERDDFRFRSQVPKLREAARTAGKKAMTVRANGHRPD